MFILFTKSCFLLITKLLVLKNQILAFFSGLVGISLIKEKLDFLFLLLLETRSKMIKKIESWFGYAFFQIQDSIVIGSLFLILLKMLLSLVSIKITVVYNLVLFLLFSYIGIKLDIYSKIRELLVKGLEKLLGEYFLRPNSFGIVANSFDCFETRWYNTLTIFSFRSLVLLRLFIISEPYLFFFGKLMFFNFLIFNHFLILTYTINLFVIVSRLCFFITDYNLTEFKTGISLKETFNINLENCEISPNWINAVKVTYWVTRSIESRYEYLTDRVDLNYYNKLEFTNIRIKIKEYYYNIYSKYIPEEKVDSFFFENNLPNNILYYTEIKIKKRNIIFKYFLLTMLISYLIHIEDNNFCTLMVTSPSALFITCGNKTCKITKEMFLYKNWFTDRMAGHPGLNQIFQLENGEKVQIINAFTTNHGLFNALTIFSFDEKQDLSRTGIFQYPAIAPDYQHKLASDVLPYKKWSESLLKEKNIVLDEKKLSLVMSNNPLLKFFKSLFKISVEGEFPSYILSGIYAPCIHGPLDHQTRIENFQSTYDWLYQYYLDNPTCGLNHAFFINMKAGIAEFKTYDPKLYVPGTYDFFGPEKDKFKVLTYYKDINLNQNKVTEKEPEVNNPEIIKKDNTEGNKINKEKSDKLNTLSINDIDEFPPP